ncbi:hypothetical protein FJ444_03095, partial [Aestuariibacter sp. GS-14]|uniref:hypothetical protein n=1 Tax=Aestuariibacter sp. GS-14 TaxID=2590670 RepID=UPI001127DF12
MLSKALLPWTKPLGVGYLAVLLSINATATTWVESEVDDPILTGETCHVSEPASYGSYVIPIRIEVCPLRVSQNDLDHDAHSE